MVWSSASSTLIGPFVFVFRSSPNTHYVPLVRLERHCSVYAFLSPDLRLFDVVVGHIRTLRPASSSGIHPGA